LDKPEIHPNTFKNHPQPQKLASRALLSASKAIILTLSNKKRLLGTIFSKEIILLTFP